MDEKTEKLLALKKEAIKKHAEGKTLTLEETALAIWDPSKKKHPMTTMGVLKLERRALDKLKTKLKDYGINSLDDIFDPKFRELGKE